MSYRTLDPDYEPSRTNPPYTTNLPSSTIPPPTTTSQVPGIHGSDPRSWPGSGGQAAYQEPSPPSSQPTVVPYAPTPPSAPTPASVSSESELYGPDRLFGPPLVTEENVGRAMMPSPEERFNEPQFPPMVAIHDPAFADEFKDDLVRAAGVVTPGVDDGPYIRYALDALTRDRDDGRGALAYPSSESGDETYQSPYHFTPTTVPSPLNPPSAHLPPEITRRDNDPRYWPIAPPAAPTTEDEARGRQQQQRQEDVGRAGPWNTEVDAAAPLIGADHHARNPPFPEQPYERGKVERNAADSKPYRNLPRNQDHWQPRSDQVTDPEMALHDCGRALNYEAPLTLKPWVLRSQSLLLLAALCLLMVAALVFCAVYSMSRAGLTPFSGIIYGGQYFVFRMLPQLLAMIILIYAQCVITAAFWVLPFSNMASDDRNERRDAVFLPLYPKSFLWPQLIGNWNIWIPILNVWLLNFTIPLQSSLFTVILVDGTWKWATVQGVAWTLVALYVSFLLALVVMLVFWHRRRTGMMRHWSIRNLADIIFLISQSNSLPQYRGLETATTRRSMQQKLSGTAERLGFWFAPEAPGIGTWYGIGVSTGADGLVTEKLDVPELVNRQRGEASPEVDPLLSSDIRHRYLPWCFRDGQIIFFAVASAILLIALIVASFLPSTDIRNGFLPLVDPAPIAGAFSAADFLYSFIPSLIGLILFLLFQPLDLMLRILTPWGELSRAEGSRAATSLLLDYATCLPFESTYKALRNKHWRVAVVSLLSPLFALLPVLGGGLFLALTPPSGIVRMFPNVPAFAIILALLFLYVGGVICLVPKRSQFRLPHAVTCLAEIISFCCDENLRADEAFDLHMMLEPHDLSGKLDLGKDWHRQGRWTFSAGRNNDERLGIKRYSKFTVNPKKLRAYDRRVRGELISTPLPQGSGSLFGR